MDLGNMKPIPTHGKTSAIWTIAFLAWPFRVIPWAGPSPFWCGLFWSLLRLDHRHFRVAFASHSLGWTIATLTFCFLSFLWLDHCLCGVAFLGHSLGWTIAILAWPFLVTPWAGPSAFWHGFFGSLLRQDHRHFGMACFAHSS